MFCVKKLWYDIIVKMLLVNNNSLISLNRKLLTDKEVFFMAFFDDVKKFGKNIADKGKDVVEITKLNSQISGEKEKIKEIYLKIGEQVYQAYKAGSETGYAEFCAQITELEAKVKELSDKVLELKNSSKCPNCGAEVGKEVAFCPKCGTKLSQ